MPNRADAHLHFFFPGYVARLPPECRRVQPDEVTLYAALAQQHNIRQVLAVAYEDDTYAGNNHYLAQLAAKHDWIRPTWFVHDPPKLTVEMLENLRRQRFVGLSLYLFWEELEEGPLPRVPDEVWSWLARNRWLVSVNSRGKRWSAWNAVLERHPDLHLLVSHLGLPPARSETDTGKRATEAMEPVLGLAKYPGVRVKLSGFYALTDPGYAYPHRAAWPYVEALLKAFGSSRLLWASDFSPCLEWVSFPQTLGLFEEMPFLDAEDRRRIEGKNLLTLLDEVACG